MRNKLILTLIIFSLLASACGAPTPAPKGGIPRVLAVESFLADIAQNVAGERLQVETLLPLGMDPHAYQATPADAAKISESDVLIINGAHLEEFIDPLLETADGTRLVIEASAGLTPRTDPQGDHPEGDPHFWLDPNNVIKYAENIRDGLSQVDPDGAETYAANAEAYIARLRYLDQWIKEQVAGVAPEKRLMVTNHESFGYFADRYGFTIVGAIIPSLSSEAAPSAQQMSDLIGKIYETGSMTIFLEAGSNRELADQIAFETGVRVVDDLYTHSLSTADGPAPNYIDMMAHNVSQIVAGCKT